MAKQQRNIQERILAAIISYMQKHDGRSPTYREIADEIQIASLGHIAYHIKALEEKRMLRHDAHKSRAFTILKDWHGNSLTNAAAVAAGQTRAILNPLIQDAIEKEGRFIFREAFILDVEGDSMIGDNILNGDHVIVDPGQSVENGDIVVAMHIDPGGSEFGAATVKRFYREENGVRLQPSNSSMAPIWVESSRWDEEWQLQGKVMAVIHEL